VHHADEPAAPTGVGGLVRVRLDIAYDGTDFSGWAMQSGRRTVQGVLQDALAQISRQPVALTVAGRTDAGVHATGQVAHTDVGVAAWEALGTSLVHRLAGVLPPDVRVTGISHVPEAFDARFSALWRRYEYRISDTEAGVNPLRRRQVLALRRSVDVAAMSRAAAALRGEHDFAAFCRYREGATSIRAIQSFDVTSEAGEIVCTVQADAFCHSMVRSLVGALIAVGEGRRPEDWPASLLTRTARADEVSVAPAHGLTLVAVGYPPDDDLAARTEQTRRRRTPAPYSVANAGDAATTG
jgi:tRNA pseudouridine38-40 synthase